MTLNIPHVIVKKSPKSKADKPPIIFVHGSWHGAWCWDEHFLDYFTEQGFDVYAPDLRGHGKTPAQKPMHWVRASDYVEDVLSVIDTMDRKPILIGHSMGGFVSQHCMRQSKNIAAVGLLATVPHYGTIPATLNVAFKHPITFAKVNLSWSMYHLVKKVEDAKALFLEENVSTQEAEAFAAKLVEEAYWGYLDSVIFNLPGKYKGDLPVHVVGAQKDNIFSVASQQATARYYGADCHIVGNAPHDLMLASMWKEAADQFIAWINKLS